MLIIKIIILILIIVFLFWIYEEYRGHAPGTIDLIILVLAYILIRPILIQLGL